MLKEIVEEIVKGLVQDKENVNVSEENTESEIKITVKVDKEDTGRVIGRQGRVIKAIRTLAKSFSKDSKKRVYVDLSE